MDAGSIEPRPSALYYGSGGLIWGYRLADFSPKTEATNRNLYVLSIVTTALLPGTLLTGFWGMNVGGLPWQDSAHGSLWTGLSLVLSIMLSLALLRGSRVL